MFWKSVHHGCFCISVIILQGFLFAALLIHRHLLVLSTTYGQSVADSNTNHSIKIIKHHRIITRMNCEISPLSRPKPTRQPLLERSFEEHVRCARGPETNSTSFWKSIKNCSCRSQRFLMGATRKLRLQLETVKRALSIPLQRRKNENKKRCGTCNHRRVFLRSLWVAVLKARHSVQNR